MKVTCSATSKRSGKRCKKSPIQGGFVCEMHGGAAPQVRRAADRRLARAAAEAALWRLGVQARTSTLFYASHPAVRDAQRPTPVELKAARLHRANVDAGRRDPAARDVYVDLRDLRRAAGGGGR